MRQGTTMPNCPTCGCPVRVVSSGEGTNSYRPDAVAVEDLEELVRATTPDKAGYGAFFGGVLDRIREARGGSE